VTLEGVVLDPLLPFQLQLLGLVVELVEEHLQRPLLEVVGSLGDLALGVVVTVVRDLDLRDLSAHFIKSHNRKARQVRKEAYNACRMRKKLGTGPDVLDLITSVICECF